MQRILLGKLFIATEASAGNRRALHHNLRGSADEGNQER